MNKIPLEKTGIDVCYEKLDSGLELYIVKKEGVKQTYVTLTTKFGSEVQEFVPRGEHQMKKVPLGVAHFLEHQMFQMEDGTDPMELFSNSGSDANAFTSTEQTTYLFSGVNDTLENLGYLIHYVSSPYFTDDSVEKEKGIIIEELKMYADDPYQMLYQKTLFNTLKNSPARYPTIGTIADIKKTTKEDLMTCYNTFYHPSNMFLIVVGNADPLEVIRVARKSDFNEQHKHDSQEKIKIKEVKEPSKVFKEYEKIAMNVQIPKISINYKLSIGQFTKEERRKLQAYLSILFQAKFGNTSLFVSKLQEEKVILETISIDHFLVGDYLIYSFMVDTKEYEEFITRFEEEMKNLTITEEDFRRKQKVMISSYIYTCDSIQGISRKINNSVIHYQTIFDNEYTFRQGLTLYELNEMVKKLSFKNKSIVIIDTKTDSV